MPSVRAIKSTYLFLHTLYQLHNLATNQWSPFESRFPVTMGSEGLLSTEKFKDNPRIRKNQTYMIPWAKPLRYLITAMLVCQHFRKSAQTKPEIALLTMPVMSPMDQISKKMPTLWIIILRDEREISCLIFEYPVEMVKKQYTTSSVAVIVSTAIQQNMQCNCLPLQRLYPKHLYPHCANPLDPLFYNA